MRHLEPKREASDCSPDLTVGPLAIALIDFLICTNSSIPVVFERIGLDRHVLAVRLFVAAALFVALNNTSLSSPQPPRTLRCGEPVTR